MSDIENIGVKTIDGKPASLGDYHGKVRLVVNVASKCGLTPQYTALEATYRKFHERGLEILGFPANEFLEQEPGTEEEILEFCTSTYDVTFPLFAKIVVKGPKRHPLYDALIAAQPEAKKLEGTDFRKNLMGHGIDTGAPDDILWNFEKFLVDREGNVVERFAPDVTPDSPLLTAALERELSRS